MNSKIEVQVRVAISENGTIACRLYSQSNLQIQREHDKWLEELRADKYLWTTKLLITQMNMPNSWEAIA